MAVNAMCYKCKSTQHVHNKQCTTCGTELKGENRKYRVRVRMTNGRWRTKVVDKLATARAIESKLNVQKIEDEFFDIKRAPILNDLWDQYYPWAKINKATHRDDYGRYNRHIKPYLGHMKMDAIKPIDIDRILNHMRKGKDRAKGRRPYSDSSVRLTFSLLRRLFNWARFKGLYEGNNPASGVTTPKVDNQVTNVLTRGQIKKLLDYLEGHYNKRAELVIKFALYSGRRRGDILKLQWKDIDLQNRFYTLQGINTKNRKTQTLPLNDKCYEVILQAKKIRKGRYVFPARTGKRYESFDSTWRRLRVLAGIKCRFHDLRHTFASYLASSGKVDIYTLQRLLGHKDIAMTQRYAHLFPGALRSGADIANTIFDFTSEEDGKG